MRTMLDAVLTRIDNHDDLSKLPVAEMSAIMQMCKMITESVDRMAAIEQKLQMRMSVDQVSNLVLNLCDFIKETAKLTEAEYEKIIGYVENSSIFRRNEIVSGPLADPNYGQHKEFDDGNDVKMTPRNTEITVDGEVVEMDKDEFLRRQADKKANFYAENGINPLPPSKLYTIKPDSSNPYINPDAKL